MYSSDLNKLIIFNLPSLTVSLDLVGGSCTFSNLHTLILCQLLLLNT